MTGASHVRGAKAAWHFAVLDGYDRREQPGRWYLVLRSRATNHTVSSQIHYPVFYEISLDGTRFEHDCFDVVAGEDPTGPGGSSEALVGFRLTADPARGVSLDLDTFGEHGRIELTPAGAG